MRIYTKELQQLSQVEDVLGRGLLYSRIEFPNTALNGKFGENYLKEMQKRIMELRVQSKAPVEGKSGFAFANVDKRSTIITNTVLGLPDDELKPLQKNLVTGKIPDPTSQNLQAILYVPKVTEKGSFFDTTGKNKEPIVNLKVGDTIKVSYPKEGYERSMENYLLITDYEKYKDLYISRDVTITGIIEDLPVKDDFHLGTNNAPYLLMAEKDFQEFTGLTGYRIISIDMKDNATEAEYQELKEKVQVLSEAIPGTNLMNEVELKKSSEEFGRQYAALRNSISAILICISGLSIYNNISYNLLSRLREYGIMKAIGLTRKQFRKMIQFEGLAYGSIAAFFACGIAFIIQLTTFVFWAYISPFPLYNKQFFFDWQPYILVIAINLAIGYLATLGPIYQVNRAEITESIRAVE
jgi:putative ABC transport system permease protein